MHSAPSVNYPVGRSPFAARVAALLVLAGLACALAWSLLAPLGWRQTLAFAAVAAGAGLARRGWLRAARGLLRWDGLAWAWEEGDRSAPGRPEVALDFQSRLLVRWREEGGGAGWLWLERASDPPRWEALRRAVYSRASAQGPVDGHPPAAER
jgi:toxin CptA